MSHPTVQITLGVDDEEGMKLDCPLCNKVDYIFLFVIIQCV